MFGFTPLKILSGARPGLSDDLTDKSAYTYCMNQIVKEHSSGLHPEQAAQYTLLRWPVNAF